MNSTNTNKTFTPSNKLSKRLKKLPFRSTLSLVPLIEYWDQAIKKGNEVDGLLALKVIEQVSQVPELLRPIEDISTLAPHRDIIEMLMTALLPPAMRKHRISAAISPNYFETIYTTPPFDTLMALHEGEMNVYASHDSSAIMQNELLWPCSFILDKCYGVDIMDKIPLTYHLKEKEGHFDRFFKPRINTSFSIVNNCDEYDRLSEDQLSQLLNELENEALWREYISPEQYHFEGFVWLDLIEITEVEIISDLKYELLTREAFLSSDNRDKIRRKLCSLFRIPDLRVGLAPFYPQYNGLERHGYQLWHSLLVNPRTHIDQIDQSIYGKVIDTQQPIIIDDLGRMAERSSVENALLERGIRNILIAPLLSTEGMLGFLELASSRPGDITALSTIKLREILPLFAVAMERSVAERENQVQALIKERCTAIHSSVAWRFHQAGVRLLGKLEEGLGAEMEPIIFKKVYPLFGITDVRNSSIARNNAIQCDLIQQLSLAQQVLHVAMEKQPLLTLVDLNQRILEYKACIENSLSTGSEVSILEFVHLEIEPVFKQLASVSSELRKIIALYSSALDTDLGIVYKRRKGYEESINALNEALANHLERAELEAQAMFPHYFDKSQTDGVQYNIYVGASLAPDLDFEDIHLQKLQFWQLKTSCEMARLAAQLRPQLPIPLEVSQLILVYSSQLSIRFRTDERRFDVDGVYNLRYEILKKRIDKALIKDTHERLTQPGTIAIVYSQEKELELYDTYIESLQRKGYLQEQVEQLELESLPGISGLKAVRIPLNLYTHVDDSSLGLP